MNILSIDADIFEADVLCERYETEYALLRLHDKCNMLRARYDVLFQEECSLESYANCYIEKSSEKRKSLIGSIFSAISNFINTIIRKIGEFFNRIIGRKKNSHANKNNKITVSKATQTIVKGLNVATGSVKVLVRDALHGNVNAITILSSSAMFIGGGIAAIHHHFSKKNDEDSKDQVMDAEYTIKSMDETGGFKKLLNTLKDAANNVKNRTDVPEERRSKILSAIRSATSRVSNAFNECKSALLKRVGKGDKNADDNAANNNDEEDTTKKQDVVG